RPSEYQAAAAAGPADGRFYDTYAVATRGPGRPPADRAAVSFWNLTGRDVVLKIGDQTEVLPRGRSVTRDLPRTFTWRVERRGGRTAEVWAPDAGLEVVIRQ